MRVFNRLLAFVVALALFAASVILIVEVIAARSGSGPLIIHWHSILGWGRRNTWKATSVELASAITAAAGLLILIPQLIRRRPGRLRIHTPDVDAPHTDAALTRKGLTVTVQSAVESVEGITRSRVKVTHQRIRVNAQSVVAQSDSADELTPLVTQAAQQRVQELGLLSARRLSVAVTPRRSGVQ
jgi:hypothetical protein